MLAHLKKRVWWKRWCYQTFCWVFHEGINSQCWYITHPHKSFVKNRQCICIKVNLSKYDFFWCTIQWLTFKCLLIQEILIELYIGKLILTATYLLIKPKKYHTSYFSLIFFFSRLAKVALNCKILVLKTKQALKKVRYKRRTLDTSGPYYQHIFCLFTRLSNDVHCNHTNKPV